MNITSQTRVGDIVRENFNAASVLTRMKIDYCCGGNRTLVTACDEVGADIGIVIRKLDQAMIVRDHDTAQVQSMPPNELCDYIIKRHHMYVRDKIPVLTVSIDKLCNVHGRNHPELFKVKDLFLTAASNLVKHMQKEEMILFPYIKHMSFCGKQNTQLKTPSFGTVANPIHMMVSEHENEGDRFRQLNEITNGYSLPEDACNTFIFTYHLLSEFEEDLHRHIHLENNILFPEAKEMEARLLKK